MKVILNTDLEGKGELGDIVEVKPGFARNYLFPKELALPVNKNNLEIMKARRKKAEKELEIQQLSANEQKVKLEELSLTFEKKAGESDVLFGSVTTSDIEKKLAELGVEIDRKKLHLDEPIKRVGHYTCKIKLVKGVEAELKIEVIPEGGADVPEPEKVEEIKEEGAVKEEVKETESVEAEKKEPEEVKEKGEAKETAEPAEVEAEPETELKAEKEAPEPKRETAEKKPAQKAEKTDKAVKEPSEKEKEAPRETSKAKEEPKEPDSDQKGETEKKPEDSEAEDKTPEV